MSINITTIAIAILLASFMEAVVVAILSVYGDRNVFFRITMESEDPLDADVRWFLYNASEAPVDGLSV